MIIVIFIFSVIFIIVKILDFEKCGVASILDLGASLFPMKY